MTDLSVSIGPVRLRSPLIAASGTVGSVTDFVGVASVAPYGAMVAKSVAFEPWPGNPAPRMAPTGVGMLNSIGIQNPGVDAWAASIGPLLDELDVDVWGSAVGHRPDEFAKVAVGLVAAGVAAIEVNLSCPNLEEHGATGGLIALDDEASGRVIEAVTNVVSIPVGAKLSPDAADIVAVAEAVSGAGAAWVVLTNTARGAGIDIESRRPHLAAFAGGYSGPALKPIALRCVADVARSLPDLPIVGCGGVISGTDVVEYLMAGASAVGLGTVHFAEPRAAQRISSELEQWCAKHDIGKVSDLIGAVERW